MLRVGTSGWHYDDWRGPFYPRALPTSGWLDFYGTQFDTVEINNSFYRLPPASTFEKWCAATPRDFSFTVKASRYLTHIKRLRDPEEPVARLLDHASGLGPKLGAVLLQLPPDLVVDTGLLAATLAAFDRRAKVACEFRHASWYREEVYALLESHDAAMCLTDRANRRGPLVRTASWAFVRLHEGTASPSPCYGDHALRHWVERIGELFGSRPTGFVYFNNDRHACAVRNAKSFAELVIRGSRG